VKERKNIPIWLSPTGWPKELRMAKKRSQRGRRGRLSGRSVRAERKEGHKREGVKAMKAYIYGVLCPLCGIEMSIKLVERVVEHGGMFFEQSIPDYVFCSTVGCPEQNKRYRLPVVEMVEIGG